MYPSLPAIQQISLSLSAERKALSPASAASRARCARDFATVRTAFLQRNGGPMSFDLQERAPPFNICLSPAFADRVLKLHDALDKALIDIVSRWITDKAANFLARMPLEKHEEDLLTWIDGPEGSKLVKPFAERYGMWRTDYLIDQSPKAVNGNDAVAGEQPKICEINARIPFNGLVIAGGPGEACKLLGGQAVGLETANDFNLTTKTVLSCFDGSEPLYHIRCEWPGVDSRTFMKDFEKATGVPVKQVTPSQLRLRKCSSSATGYMLCFAPSSSTPSQSEQSSHSDSKDHSRDTANPGSQAPEELVDIPQAAVELFQSEIAEIASIDPRLLQHLAPICVNDLRSVLLVHDKRILGIVSDEIPGMISRGVLDETEGRILEAGIAETILPGTPAMRKLLSISSAAVSKTNHHDHEKTNWIIKPVRDAACNGIKLGRNISQGEWLETLNRLAQQPPLRPDQDACVVQKLVDHVWFDIAGHDEDWTEPEKYHLIASQHMINSKLNVFGPWRLGNEIHLGVRVGKETLGGRSGLVMSTVLRPEKIAVNNDKEIE